ncbi:MAG: (deoxy)nucleoside triphosphate pyrophosphohydrolase [Novosphingobium sp.]
MTEISTVIPVVAAALIDGRGLVCMQQRRFGAAHGGLWEFPGGKVEPQESPESALLREIEEELGVRMDPTSLIATAFASDPALPPEPRAPHVILLYTCRHWQGEVRCLDGEQIAWVPPGELAGLAMPPLDYPLARQLVKLLAVGTI